MAKIKHKSKAKKFQIIALERIKTLFKEANLIAKKDKKLADKYVQLAREISMKYKLKIPKELKRRFCKHCHSYLIPGINLRVRTKNKHVVYYCLDCKRFMRFPYVREKKLKKKRLLVATSRKS